MSYIIKARYYAYNDQFGESYIITSNHLEEDTKLEVGLSVLITPDLRSCITDEDSGRDIGAQKSRQKKQVNK